MAHIGPSITVFVNAPPLPVCREGTPLQTQGLPRALFIRELAATGHVFLASSSSTCRGCSVGGAGRLLIEQIQAAVFSNQICS